MKYRIVNYYPATKDRQQQKNNSLLRNKKFLLLVGLFIMVIVVGMNSNLEELKELFFKIKNL
ncbi:MAG: hypothetical protein ACQEQI_00395 [Bacillota bacterium]